MAKECRISGIYAEGGKHRLVVYWPERKSIWCHTREEAEQIKAKLEAILRTQGTRTVDAALAEYLAHLSAAGRKPETVSLIARRLRNFLPLDCQLSALTAEAAAELYKVEVDRLGRFGRPLAAATHRHALKCAKAFFRWLVEDRKYLPSNPFARVKPMGRENTGKIQLRLDEARRFCAHLIRQAEAEDAAKALLTLLVLGPRPSEVMSRRVKDVDDGGRLFWIEDGKTKNARRALEVRFPPLQELLIRQTAGRNPDDLLFGATPTRPYGKDYLRVQLKRYCQEACVTEVCPHSLRGLHSTLAIERGATSGLVAAALGHKSFAITARHYVDPSTLANTRIRRVTAALVGKPR